MKIAKKVILSLSITFVIAISFVIAWFANGFSPKASAPSEIPSNNEVSTQTGKKEQKLTFRPGEVRVQKGADAFNFKYNANSNTTSGESVAYEYVFSNPMERETAVNLKSVKSDGTVSISYHYKFGSELDTETETFTATKNFACRKMAVNSDRLYAYVIVTPAEGYDEIDFTSNVVWYYGIPKEIPIVDSITNERIDTQTIVTGQMIDENTLTPPDAPEDGYFFDAWFIDKEFTQLVFDNEVKPGKQVYARYHNFPIESTEYATYNSETDSYSIRYSYELVVNVLPTIYYDGENKPAKVTSLIGGAEANVEIQIPVTVEEIRGFEYSPGTKTDFSKAISLRIIHENAFSNCYSIEYIDLRNCISLETIDEGAFMTIERLKYIILPENLKTLGSSAFIDCNTPFTIYNLSGLDSINSHFYDYYGNSNITIFNSLDNLK